MSLWTGRTEDGEICKFLKGQCNELSIQADADIDKHCWSAVGRKVCGVLREGGCVSIGMVPLFLCMLAEEIGNDSSGDEAPARRCMEQLIHNTRLSVESVVDGLRSAVRLQFDARSFTLCLDNELDPYCFVRNNDSDGVSRSDALPRIGLVWDKGERPPLTILRARALIVGDIEGVPTDMQTALSADLHASLCYVPVLRSVRSHPMRSLRTGQMVDEAVLGKTAFTHHLPERHGRAAVRASDSAKRMHMVLGVVLQRELLAPESDSVLRAWTLYVNSESVQWLHEVSHDFLNKLQLLRRPQRFPVTLPQTVASITAMVLRFSLHISSPAVHSTDCRLSTEHPLTLPASLSTPTLHRQRLPPHPGGCGTAFFLGVSALFPEHTSAKPYAASGSIDRPLAHLLAFGNQAPMWIAVPPHGMLLAFDTALTGGQLLNAQEAPKTAIAAIKRLRRWLGVSERWSIVAQPLLTALQSACSLDLTADALWTLFFRLVTGSASRLCRITTFSPPSMCWHARGRRCRRRTCYFWSCSVMIKVSSIFHGWSERSTIVGLSSPSLCDLCWSLDSVV